jgi:uncharacterized circularly permuted ATP-grasp superfamily protein
MGARLFEDYTDQGFFDEVVDRSGAIRPEYRTLVDLVDSLGPDEITRRERLQDASFRSKGITFTVYGDDEGVERTFPMDLLPRIIPGDDWAEVERGLGQRVKALNLFLEDLYVGQQSALRDGIVPRRLITSSDGFRREAFGIRVPHGARCVVAGIDLVRDGEGVWRVLEDNVRNPSGISYVLENRGAMTRIFPKVTGAHRLRSVDHYGSSLLASMRALAPAPGGDPCVIVLTPGAFNSAYYEHAFAARQMGVELVEGRDLVVDDHVVYLRTTHGLERVDVIYRRIDDEFLDPVGFRTDSVIGVPGLLGALRAGNVTVANAVGNGVADDKAVYPFVPDLIRYYLGEEPVLANVDTYLLWEPEQRTAVLERLDELVVKPVAEAGGYGVLIGPQASDEELAEARADIEADPRNWIAQEVVSLSRHPILDDDNVSGRHIDLRPFVLTRGDDVEVIPGGLTRVALRQGSLIVNSSQGGGSKDTWVLVDDHSGIEAPDEADLTVTPTRPTEGGES